MEPEDSPTLVLKWRALLIACLPILVFAASDWFLNEYGQPNPMIRAAIGHHFDGHAEAARRIHVLATFILVVAGALSACLFFAIKMLRYPSQARLRLLAAYVAAIVTGGLLLLAMGTSDTQDYVGPETVCIALGPTDAGGNLVQPKYHEIRPGVEQCASENFRLLRHLLLIERNLLILAIAALALGAISCTALPAVVTDRRFTARIIRVQAQRLRTYLYLSATLLVMGLLFLNAFLRWPGYIYSQPAHFTEHASAIVLYLGISYSILLTSYYAPVALILSKAARRSGDSETAAMLKSAAQSDPANAIKVAAAIFAPALASVFTGLLDFS